MTKKAKKKEYEILKRGQYLVKRADDLLLDGCVTRGDGADFAWWYSAKDCRLPLCGTMLKFLGKEITVDDKGMDQYGYTWTSWMVQTGDPVDAPVVSRQPFDRRVDSFVKEVNALFNERFLGLTLRHRDGFVGVVIDGCYGTFGGDDCFDISFMLRNRQTGKKFKFEGYSDNIEGDFEVLEEKQS